MVWLTEHAVWAGQWMLTLEELAVATQLVEGHLSLDISSPVSVILFLISRQWSYYKTQELSMVMQPMGALQPGLPFPYAVPFTWDLMVLKDAYLLVPPLSPGPPCFVFRLPWLNFQDLWLSFN